ncbi:MAG: hypothetical protein OXG39_01220 [Chloroflexi bacterium]|nr:hypothetical protein [Chloroflexota bacterium]
MKFKLAILTGLMLLVSACGVEISGEIYLADLDELTDNNDLTTKILIALPFIETDDCEAETRRYQDVINRSSGFSTMEFVRCYPGDYGNYVEFELPAPMRMADPYESSMVGAIEIIGFDDEETGDRHIYIRSNPSDLCNLDKLTIDEFWQSLDFSELSPLIHINNDLREPQKLILNHVFVNGSPVIQATEFELERRDSIEVALSDVITAWVFNKSCNFSSRTALIGIWVADSGD